MRAVSVALGTLMAANAMSAEIGIESFGWLAGCWQPDKGDAGSIEHWLPPAGGTMLGVSRTVKNGKTVEFEFMQLRTNAEGKLVFIALPSGQQETTFVSSSVRHDSVTFENPEHDFPQKVIYRLQSEGRLVARIEGTRDGKVRGVDFPMKRVSCDALAGATASPASTADRGSRN
ncbi:DUF6265 family protein [Steroidobacter flavus]|uniref:DUF6265 family protein n=1 Tax=Steroidobacter flavus TaxID=1842136 RepID=A0ABV8SVW6_9GAMM